jgi:hypothetical protein
MQEALKAIKVRNSEVLWFYNPSETGEPSSLIAS